MEAQCSICLLYTSVGVGIDIEAFSAALGLPTLRAPGEAPIPIGDDGYYLFRALLLGAPEDVQAMRDANWLERSLLEDNVQLDTKNPLSQEWGRSRGKLTTEQDVDCLSLIHIYCETTIMYKYTNLSGTSYQCGGGGCSDLGLLNNDVTSYKLFR